MRPALPSLTRRLGAAAIVLLALPALTAATPTYSWRDTSRPPQIPGIDKLLKRLKAQPEPVTSGRGLLACELWVTGRLESWDNALLRSRSRYPDPAATVTIGKKTYRSPSNEDSSMLWFTLPAIEVKPGMSIKVRLEDVDISRNDHIATMSGKLGKSWPIELKARLAEGKCYWASEASVAAALSAALDKVTRTLDAFKKATASPDLSKREAGYPRREYSHATRALKAAAGYVGWEDARVAEQLKAFDAIDAAWDARARALVKQTYLSAEALKQGVVTQEQSTIAIEQVRGTCDPKAIRRGYALAMKRNVHVRKDDVRCVVELRMTNKGEAPVRVNSFFGEVGAFGKGFKVQGLMDNGMHAATTWVGVRAPKNINKTYKKDLAPGATITAVVAVYGGELRAHHQDITVPLVTIQGRRGIKPLLVLPTQ